MKTFLRNLAAAATLLTGMLPPLHAADIVETAANSGSFKTFVEALKTAGVNQQLKDAGPYTVFAPTDEAFNKLPNGTWNAIKKDKEKLAQVLSYHVIPGKVLVSEVKPGKAKTTQGSELMLTSDNGLVKVNGANVTQSDVTADNGVIHAIDTVMLPPDSMSGASGGGTTGSSASAPEKKKD